MIGLAYASDLGTSSGAPYVALYGCVIIAICALAAVKPVRSTLRIPPSEALRADP